MVLGLRSTASAAPNANLTRGLGRRLAHFLSWALVLLLLADIISAPLHRHRHDSGIDGSAIQVPLVELQRDTHRCEEDRHELNFVHAVTTVRTESHASASDVCAGADDQHVALASAGMPWVEADTPLHRLHRSLPPAGRAPPLRA
ncbi:MAG: hypothetical protein ABT20_16185 [Rubrivivax sp. SCN 70-15]|nr:MAG: hypothetical protein ABT20_16185 [Rubrivivax sp. SCN 70-15]